MEHAIYTLESRIKQCESMRLWYEDELLKHNYISCEQSEIERLNSELKKCIDTSKECLFAIELIKHFKDK